MRTVPTMRDGLFVALVICSAAACQVLIPLGVAYAAARRLVRR